MGYGNADDMDDKELEAFVNGGDQMDEAQRQMMYARWWHAQNELNGKFIRLWDAMTDLGDFVSSVSAIVTLGPSPLRFDEPITADMVPKDIINPDETIEL